MRERPCVFLAALLLASTTAIVGFKVLPLGLPGEWVWNRTPNWPPAHRLVMPILATIAYTGLLIVAVTLADRLGKFAAICFLPAMLLTGWQLQAHWLDMPQPPFGIERWPTSIVHPATSGYFEEARRHRLTEFLRNYENWVAQSDVFHKGTHPPGLFVIQQLLLGFFQSHPSTVIATIERVPERFRLGLDVIADDASRRVKNTQGKLNVADLAAVSATMIVTWIASLLTLVPIYLLARQSADRSASLLAAGLWPLVPASPLFLPVGDCLFPVMAVAIVAMVHSALNGQRRWLALPAGLLWFLGMFTSLAFVAVLPIILGPAILELYFRRSPPRKNALRELLLVVMRFAAGAIIPLMFFRIAFGLDLIAVWRINLAKHAGFYAAMPRSYFAWIGIDVVEFLIVLGPAMAAMVFWLAFESVRNPRLVASQDVLEAQRRHWGRLTFGCFLLTLLALDISGRNRSEVARLWIFLTPFACATTAWATGRVVRSPISIAALAISQSAAAMVLIARVEPLLPISLSP